MQISGKSRIYCLIGDPVDHSLSPVMQNAAFHSARIDAVYVPFQVKPANLKRATEGLRVLGVKGFNVTTPHKVTIMRFLERLDRAAEEIGSVNTVKNEGILVGYSTDGIGALNALQEVANPKGKSAVIIGAGGAGKAIAYALAPKIGSLKILNRTCSTAKALQRKLQSKFKIEVHSGDLTQREIEKSVTSADIIVNASSMGMEGKEELPINQEWLKPGQVVFDIVYRPLQTPLIKKAKIAGANTLTGLDMLVHQGACSFELWTGETANLGVMRQAIDKKLRAVPRANR